MNSILKSSKLYFILSLIIVLFIFLKITSIYFGNNPLNKNKNTYKDYVAVFPQGWAFFTKNSREPLLYVYEYRNNTLIPFTYRNFSNKSYFGASRHNRIINIQSAQLINKIHQISLIPLNEKSLNIETLEKKILKMKFLFVKISIEKKHIPNIKGKYIVIIQKQLPWGLISKDQYYKSEFLIYPIEIL